MSVREKRKRERDGERKQENPAFLRSYKIFLIGLTPPPPWHVFSTENPEEKISRDENVKKGNSSSEGWTRFRLGRSSRQRGLVGAWVFSSTPKVETMVGVG